MQSIADFRQVKLFNPKLQKPREIIFIRANLQQNWHKTKAGWNNFQWIAVVQAWMHNVLSLQKFKLQATTGNGSQ